MQFVFVLSLSKKYIYIKIVHFSFAASHCFVLIFPPLFLPVSVSFSLIYLVYIYTGKRVCQVCAVTDKAAIM